jgi:hypothetical protein
VIMLAKLICCYSIGNGCGDTSTCPTGTAYTLSFC